MIRETLNKLILSRNMSHKQLALGADISESQLSKFLSGTKEPRIKDIIALSKVLKVKPGEMLEYYSLDTTREELEMGEYLITRRIIHDAISGVEVTSVYVYRDMKNAHFDIDMGCNRCAHRCNAFLVSGYLKIGEDIVPPLSHFHCLGGLGGKPVTADAGASLTFTKHYPAGCTTP